MNLSKHVDENGMVRVLRVLNTDGTSYGGFNNGLNPGDKIVCPDWEPTDICGNGLHGWPWGRGRCDKEHTGNKLWQVVLANPRTGVDLGGKAKWPEFEVLYTGGQAECMKLLLPGLQEWVIAHSMVASTSDRGLSASASGYGLCASTSGSNASASTSGGCTSASTSGYGSSSSASGHDSSASTSADSSSASVSGHGSSANTSAPFSSASASSDSSSSSTSDRYSSASTSGLNSSASTSGSCSSASTSGPSSSASTSGDSSSASASGYGVSASTSGDRSSASTSGRQSSASTSGNASAAVCNGIGSRAKSGPFGIIALTWWNDKLQRYEMLCERVGDGNDDMLKPHTWYHVIDGAIVAIDMEGIE